MPSHANATKAYELNKCVLYSHILYPSITFGLAWIPQLAFVI